uniref:Membrane protein n=1 Tax=Serratia phage Spe5P4 TaxID=3159438 RepID=A0AAU7VI61_9CAUD
MKVYFVVVAFAIAIFVVCGVVAPYLISQPSWFAVFLGVALVLAVPALAVHVYRVYILNNKKGKR